MKDADIQLEIKKKKANRTDIDDEDFDKRYHHMHHIHVVCTIAMGAINRHHTIIILLILWINRRSNILMQLLDIIRIWMHRLLLIAAILVFLPVRCRFSRISSALPLRHAAIFNSYLWLNLLLLGPWDSIFST